MGRSSEGEGAEALQEKQRDLWESRLREGRGCREDHRAGSLSVQGGSREEEQGDQKGGGHRSQVSPESGRRQD